MSLPPPPSYEMPPAGRKLPLLKSSVNLSAAESPAARIEVKLPRLYDASRVLPFWNAWTLVRLAFSTRVTLSAPAPRSTNRVLSETMPLALTASR